MATQVNQVPQAPPKESKKGLWIGIAAVIIVVALVAVFIANSALNGAVLETFKYSDINEVRHTNSQDMFTGDVTVQITLINEGNKLGSAKVEVSIWQGDIHKTGSKTVSLAAGEETTISIKLDCPFGTAIYDSSVTVEITNT